LAASMSALAPAAFAQAAQPSCSTVAGNLVGDCGFETPSLGTASGQINANAGAAFPDPTGPWISGSGVYEIQNNSANGALDPNSGKQSVDLNPNGTSSLMQNIATQTGHVYSVTFALAGNATPNGFFVCAGSPFIKTLTVSFGGASQTYS